MVKSVGQPVQEDVVGYGIGRVLVLGMDVRERYGKEERKINLHDLICR